MKVENMSQAQLAQRIMVAQAGLNMARALAPNTPVGGGVRVDDRELRKTMAMKALAQKMHAGAAAATKATDKANAKPATHPELAMSAPSPRVAPASVRVAPTASSSHARSFAERARNAAK